MIYIFIRAACLVLFFLFTSCALPRFNTLLKSANNIANNAGLTQSHITGEQFTLLTYSKINSQSKEVTIYIEGDGKSWITRNKASANPTPHNPVALKLAAADKHSKNIIYLGRPCQFQPTNTNSICEAKYWTYESYSEVIVASLNSAINKLNSRYGFTQIHLVGFSGGGALAVLIAAKRQDVTSIRTIAGNLDVALFTRMHNVSPMTESLNPADYAARTEAIPQRHFIGNLDKIIPREIGESYLKHLRHNNCAFLTEVEHLSHHGNWPKHWNMLLMQPLQCVGRIPPPAVSLQ